ncbi:MAG TPA: iron ABC transporter permease [Symbiobacteriaceae bacterium]|nr:iron ABC transporter permease [Symbiobacteriaceae bacterium]
MGRLTLRFDAKSLAIAGAVALLLLFGAFPIILLVVKSFTAEGRVTLENFIRVYGNEANMRSVLDTCKVAGLTMIVSVLISFPLAWLVGRSDLPLKGLFRTLIVTPYMIPPFVGAIAWTYLANPRIGYLNRIFQSLFGTEQAPFNIYSMGGLVWVFVLFYFPFSFLAVSRALEKMDPSLEEAARISGAGTWRVLRDVTIPLMTPALVAGALLVFVAVASAFGVPAIIGGPAQLHVVTTQIINYVYIGTPEALRESTALATVLLAMAMTVLWFSNWYVSRREYFTVGGKSTRPSTVELGKWRWPLAILFGAVCFVFAVLPIGALVMTSFIKSMGQPIGGSNWSLDTWKTVLEDRETWKTLKVSLITAVSTATVATLVGLLIAYLKVKTRIRFRAVPDFLATFTNATPGIVVALGLIIAFSGGYGLNLYGTIWILIVAYFVHHLSFAVRTSGAALEQMHPSLEEAALSSGAGWLRVFKDITIPLVAPSLIGGWFLVFMPSFYELTMSVLLFSTRTRPSGVFLYDLQSYADPQSAAVLSVLILTLVLVGNGLMKWATRGRVGI